MYSSVKMRECLGAVWQLLPEIIIVPSYSRAEVKGALLACQEANFLLYQLPIQFSPVWPPAFQPILKLPISVTALCLQR